MCDQMRWDAAGFSGRPTVRTPNLDRLAALGVCFENAYCASPVCSPARASWLTGLYPHAHLQLRNYSPSMKGVSGIRLPPDRTTIGDVLKAAGYRCGLVGPWHLGDDHRPQHGFTDFWRTYRYQGEHRVATPLAGVDLMPTLLDLAGQVPPSPIDGRSVAGAILGGREPDPRPVFAEISSQEAIFQWAEEPEQLAAHVMVRDGDWKYVRNRFDIDELYDLKTDPGEMENLAARPEHQERVASMRGLIAGMVQHTGPGPYEWCLG